MEDTVFGKIVRGEIPAKVVYQDDDVMAFLDREPNNPGHTLVIPKKVAKNVFDIDEASFLTLMKIVRKIAPAVRDAVGATGVNILMNNEPEAGQTVFHAHVHIIPRFGNDKMKDFPPSKPVSTHTEEETEEIAERIRKNLA